MCLMYAGIHSIGNSLPTVYIHVYSCYISICHRKVISIPKFQIFTWSSENLICFTCTISVHVFCQPLHFHLLKTMCYQTITWQSTQSRTIWPITLPVHTSLYILPIIIVYLHVQIDHMQLVFYTLTVYTVLDRLWSYLFTYWSPEILYQYSSESNCAAATYWRLFKVQNMLNKNCKEWITWGITMNVY